MIKWDLLGRIIQIITMRHKDKIHLSDYMGLINGYEAKNEYQVAYHLFEIVRALVRSDVDDPELYDLVNKAVIPS
jgi:hypothetical protein